MKNVVTGVLAGVIVFIWVMVSWMALPWHNTTFEKFQNQEAATQAIVQNAPTSGVYIYPGMDATPEQMAQAPHIFTVASLKGKSLPVCMGFGLLIQVLAGLVITCLVSKASVSTFKEKWVLVIKAAVFAGIVGVLPNWNWWSFPLDYTAIAFADLLIGWFLAGLWIAKRT